MERNYLIPSPSSHRSHFGQEGFTLAELLVGSALVLIAMVGAMTLLVSGTSNRNRTEARDRHEALIDDDVSRIGEIARNYTWCSGVATFNGAACNGVDPGHEDYYFPNPANDVTNSTTFVQDFNTACTSTSDTPIGQPARTNLINVLINQLPAAQLTATNGELVRAVAVPDGPATAQRIRITYTNQTNTVTRLVTLIPPVAKWCR